MWTLESFLDPCCFLSVYSTFTYNLMIVNCILFITLLGSFLYPATYSVCIDWYYWHILFHTVRRERNDSYKYMYIGMRVPISKISPEYSGTIHYCLACGIPIYLCVSSGFFSESGPNLGRSVSPVREERLHVQCRYLWTLYCDWNLGIWQRNRFSHLNMAEGVFVQVKCTPRYWNKLD